MQNEKNDLSTVCEMFEEMKETQDQQSADIKAILERLEAPAPMVVPSEPAKPATPLSVRLGTEDRVALKTLTDKLDENGARIEMLTPKIDGMSEKLDRPQTLRHTFNLEGNWGIATLIFAVVSFFVSLAVIDHQRETIAGLRDNDLKYRHIQMRGTATPADIERIRTVFDWNRNADSIRTIRKQVEQYERLIREGIEKSERARLNEKEAERLKKEAETVKGGK